MEILISIKNVYGIEKIYPECETSKNFAAIAGTTTLTDKTINIIRKMGYQVKIKSQQLAA